MSRHRDHVEAREPQELGQRSMRTEPIVRPVLVTDMIQNIRVLHGRLVPDHVFDPIHDHEHEPRVRATTAKSPILRLLEFGETQSARSVLVREEVDSWTINIETIRVKPCGKHNFFPHKYKR